MAQLKHIEPATQFAEFKPTIDERQGIITGMSVITEGEASGHGFRIDATTLKTCLAATKSHPDGVLCKGDHGTGVFEALGTLKNFRIDGKKLRADLHLLNSHPRRESVLELARRMPNALGLSISFSYAPEIIEEEVFVRVKSLFSIDLVDNPAANTGMFSQKPAPKLSGFARTVAAFKAEREAQEAKERQHKASLSELPANLRGLERTIAAFAQERKIAAKRL